MYSTISGYHRLRSDGQTTAAAFCDWLLGVVGDVDLAVAPHHRRQPCIDGMIDTDVAPEILVLCFELFTLDPQPVVFPPQCMPLRDQLSFLLLEALVFGHSMRQLISQLNGLLPLVLVFHHLPFRPVIHYRFFGQWRQTHVGWVATIRMWLHVAGPAVSIVAGGITLAFTRTVRFVVLPKGRV
jgi:hypothetical protein